MGNRGSDYNPFIFMENNLGIMVTVTEIPPGVNLGVMVTVTEMDTMDSDSIQINLSSPG